MQFKFAKSVGVGAEQLSSKFEKELPFSRPGAVKVKEFLFSSKKLRYRDRLRSQKLQFGSTVKVVLQPEGTRSALIPSRLTSQVFAKLWFWC